MTMKKILFALFICGGALSRTYGLEAYSGGYKWHYYVEDGGAVVNQIMVS